MKKYIKDDKGVSMITMILAIVIMLIIIGMLVYNSMNNIKITKVNKMYEDIDLLNTKVSEYYTQYGGLPVLKSMQVSSENISEIQNKNPNDNDKYYYIDLSAIPNINLNYGKDYNLENAKDAYIINEKTQTIYYLQGVDLGQDDVKYYKSGQEDEINNTDGGKIKLIPNNTEWTNKDVIVTAEWMNDLINKKVTIGTSTIQNPNTIIVKNNGTLYAEAYQKDISGNKIMQTLDIHNIDKILPRNVEIINSSNEMWTNQEVNLTLNSSDNESGIKEYQYSTDKKEWNKNYKNQVLYNNEIDGLMYVRVLDNAGNYSEINNTILKIDKTLPSVGLNPSGGKYVIPTGSNVAKIEFILSAKDLGGSKLDLMQYAWSTSNTLEPTQWTDFENDVKIIKNDVEAGKYYIWTKVTDKAGNRATDIKVSNEFTVGSDTITLIPNTTEWTNEDVTVTVTYGNSLTKNRKSGIGSATVDNKTNITLTENGVVYAQAEDIANNKITNNLNVSNIDKINSIVTFGTNGNTTWQGIHGTKVTVADTNSGVNSSSLKYQWTPSTTAPMEASFTSTFKNGEMVTRSIGTGIYYLWILAKDNAGNTTITRSNAFYMDNTAPSITLTPSTTAPTNVTITAIINDNVSVANTKWASGRQTASYFRNSGTVLSGTTFIVSANGTYTVYAKDTAGNETVQTITVSTIDNTVPIVTFGTNGNTTWQGIHGTKVTVQDTNSGVNSSSLKYQWTTSTTAPTEASFNSTFTNGEMVTRIGTGIYYLWILAKDNAGNTTITRSNAFYMDNTAPSITLLQNPTVITNLDVTIRAKINDNVSVANTKWASGTQTASYFRSSGTVLSGTTFMVNVNDTYTVYAKDTAGNETVQTITVSNIDKTAPIVTFGTNGNTTWSKSQNTTVTVSDANSGLNTTSLKYQWATSTTAPTEASFTSIFSNGRTITNNTSTGRYYLWILAKDNLGNTTITRSNAFYIDNTVPTITLEKDINTTPLKIQGTKVTVTDANSGASVLKYFWSNGILVKEPSESAYTSTFTNGGTITNSTGTYYYYLYILVKDSAGNVTKRSTNGFFMDNTVPTVTFGTNGNTTWSNTQSTTVSISDIYKVVLNGKIQDIECSGINSSSLKYQWTPSTTAPTEASFTSTFTNGGTITNNTSTGQYYLWILAKDNVGNRIITRSNVFYLDNIAPSAATFFQPTQTSAIFLKAVDTGGSGLSSITLPNGTSVNANGASEYTTSYNPTKNGTYLFMMLDKAGNFKTVAYTVTGF